MLLVRVVIKNHEHGWLLSIGILVSMPVISVVRFGNVDLVLALLVSALLFSSSERPRTANAAGIVLGMIVAIKLSYATLIVYYVILKEWRTVGVSLAVLLGCILLPLAVMEPGIYADYFRTASAYGQGNAGVINQSMNATISRILTESPYYGPADVQKPTAVFLSTIVSTVILAATFLLLWKQRVEYRHGLCIVVVITLLTSPITWFAHCVVLVPVVLYVLRCWRLTWTTLFSFVGIFGWLYIINPFPELTLAGKLWASHGTFGLVLLGVYLLMREGDVHAQQPMGELAREGSN